MQSTSLQTPEMLIFGERIVFEAELASVGPEGKRYRYFCQTCQEEKGGRRHHFETTPFLVDSKMTLEQEMDETAKCLSEMKAHAVTHK